MAISYANQPHVISSCQYLTVSEIERLAKAGVTITLGEIVAQSDPIVMASAPPSAHQNGNMDGAIWDRWERSKRAPYNDPYDRPLGFILPFSLLATKHGDKVFVSVHPTNWSYEPFMLEDIAAIFPSDALMASLALWEKEHPTP